MVAAILRCAFFMTVFCLKFGDCLDFQAGFEMPELMFTVALPVRIPELRKKVTFFQKRASSPVKGPHLLSNFRNLNG